MKMTKSKGAPRRTLLAKVRERFRYGLVAQEAVERLARIGVIYYPYYLVVEGACNAPEVQGGDTGRVRFAKLGPEHAPLVAGLPCRPRKLERVLELMDKTTWYGVFDGAGLAGYARVDFDGVDAPAGGTRLFTLDDRSAYLLDVYVSRAHRGRRHAPRLRRYLHGEIRGQGRETLYSITLAANGPSRRANARAGNVEVEKRLAAGLLPLGVHDMRIKALTDHPLPTPKSITFPLRTKEGSAN